MKPSKGVVGTTLGFLCNTQKCNSLSSHRQIINVLKENSRLEWDNRLALQEKWTNEEKGWKCAVEWRNTQYGVGLFSVQNIDAGTVIRVGKNGSNLLQFESIDDIERFIKGYSNDSLDGSDEESLARLRYVADYLWGFNPHADERGYYDVESEENIDRFFGMWIPGNGLNHSTSPNTVYRAAAEGGVNEGIDLVALCDISKGEELYDDYVRHGKAPLWLKEFANKYNTGLNFGDCNDFVESKSS
mmetsp:Transcript_22054/g.32586  ORF Transcript_22054/g.32586 Transcript_22054/m.32586 type:complete len:244 (-) Transcript_22054:98-829(-)|eukprot:CAMPEP_0194250354 /NCGR_PEP_ID=MMETSP0158-20130606/22826_1 /TAXON_ID=33649 /ORGANISM="Thalassionema nitzschioides, Strain L26-B" /LENGTH=243 /DNA_ID=CAMNT_0038987139 /DNA_START=45 /DNA_END=776 /DNA_ORIENTATION=-